MARENRGFENNKITCNNLILCEGRDEYGFLKTYMSSSIFKEIEVEQKIQTIDFGGNDQLGSFLNLLLNTDGYNLVRRILIVRDAEKNYQSAIDQIIGALRKNELNQPKGPGEFTTQEIPQIAYILLPKVDEAPCNGTLEDLCIQIIKPEYLPEKVLDKVVNVMQELSSDRVRSFKHEFKTKLHSFFSLTDDFVGSKVGEAARYGAFDWSSERLFGLKKLIMEMIADSCDSEFK